MEDDTDDEQQV